MRRSSQADMFSDKVWKICKKVPRGKVTTYKAIAHKLDSRAYRAVGTALNKNPFAPHVPCHRVVNSDGKIGGFASGQEKKIVLLKKEGIGIEDGKIKDFEKRIFRL